MSCMELIDAMPPGLYEAVITEVDENTVRPDLVGQIPVRLESAHWTISAHWEPRAADDLRFATVARVSEINKGLRPSSRRLCAWLSLTMGPKRPGQRIPTGCASPCSPTRIL